MQFVSFAIEKMTFRAMAFVCPPGPCTHAILVCSAHSDVINNKSAIDTGYRCDNIFTDEVQNIRSEYIRERTWNLRWSRIRTVEPTKPDWECHSSGLLFLATAPNSGSVMLYPRSNQFNIKNYLASVMLITISRTYNQDAGRATRELQQVSTNRLLEIKYRRRFTSKQISKNFKHSAPPRNQEYGPDSLFAIYLDREKHSSIRVPTKDGQGAAAYL
jgi:hypothetical protein